MRHTRLLPLLAALAFALFVQAGIGDYPQAAAPDAPSGKEWESEQMLGLNKEKPRATFNSYADVLSAKNILPEFSQYHVSLDGAWKFNWVKRPEERPVDFFKPGFEVSGWKEIAVPSSWQTQGYDVPVYSNQAYFFRRDWPHVMGEPPRHFTTFVNRNPVGSYRRDFEIPARWKGREVFINFDGVDSFFYLWINGRYVGFSKDSRSPAEFNVTRFLKPGKNVVAAEVYRFSDGSYLECQDMWRLSGIFRSVAIHSKDKTHVRDLFVQTTPAVSEESGQWKLSAAVDIRKVGKRIRVDAMLYDEAGKEVSPIAVAREKGANGEMVFVHTYAHPAGRRKDFEEFLLRSEPYEREAQPLQGPGFAARGFDQNVVVTDFKNVRAGGGDGGAGAGVDDVRDLVGRGVFGGLCGGGSRQAEPEQYCEHCERQPQKGQTLVRVPVFQVASFL